MVICESKPFKMNKLKETAARVDGAIEPTATEVKADHMTSVLIAFYAIPRAAVTILLILIPGCNLGIRQRIS